MYFFLILGVLLIFGGRFLTYRGRQKENRIFMKQFGHEKTRSDTKKMGLIANEKNVMYKKILFLFIIGCFLELILMVTTIVLFCENNELCILTGGIVFLIAAVNQLVFLLKYNLSLKYSSFLIESNTRKLLNYGNIIISIGFLSMAIAVAASYIN
ncbi:hypothetical protein FC89_GL000543 [Liquorilactobacillus ghanensis DSM 18630]|uniref:Uncharacterized protein n=1 Tax=Liquorilactobacillus ghanensis DSM 18630 TaxID=1423750 RepID=A0A0R1VLI6_9LACO|nr:hypothetical protein [Liquorilactobacillus ghanensis]KRM06402.1 hypothetical protein FC89_GL000543 [Liquorilactobacillus ghanensis DSM 18630]